MSRSANRPTDEDDDHLHRIVVDRLNRGGFAGSVNREWASGPDAWVITVKPVNTAAATLTTFVREHDVWLGIGYSYSEIFTVEGQTWDLIDRLIEAVFAGKIQEAGRGSDRFARADTRSGMYTFGRAHLPLPWRWRKAHQFAAYQARTS